jgi:hypothetical protein
MLPVKNQGDLRAAFENGIYLLGTSATWSPATSPATTKLLTIGAKIVGRNDVEVINAIGIGGRIITTAAKDYDSLQPAKFDTYTIGSKVYTVNSIHDVWLNGVLIGWKILARARE